MAGSPEQPCGLSPTKGAPPPPPAAGTDQVLPGNPTSQAQREEPYCGQPHRKGSQSPNQPLGPRGMQTGRPPVRQASDENRTSFELKNLTSCATEFSETYHG